MATQNLTLGSAWDDTFNGWTGELLLGRKYKKPAASGAAKSSWTGSVVATRQIADYPGRSSKADVHARLTGIARRTRQVMIKITGGGKNSKTIKNHFDYLSRNGELTLQDQDGQEIAGREALEKLSWAWRHIGPALDESGQRKEAFNIVFSMHEGTDERAVAAAVRATAEIEFAGHPWVMVQHFDEPHVHAHVCVKTEALDGQRLNPRKADLQRWRERFAYELRERGVEAEATRRAARLQRDKINTPWAVTRLEERGVATTVKPAQPNVEQAAGWQKAEDEVASSYTKITASLAQSSDEADRSLARELQQHTAQAMRQNKQRPKDGPMHSIPELERL